MFVMKLVRHVYMLSNPIKYGHLIHQLDYQNNAYMQNLL